jgi:hypothetical protein
MVLVLTMSWHLMVLGLDLCEPHVGGGVFCEELPTVNVLTLTILV